MVMNLAIVDQQHIFREGFQRLLEKEKDINIVVSAGTISEVCDEQAEDIEVFLIDMATLKRKKEELMKWIRHEVSDQKIVALADRADRDSVRLAISIGCHGYLLKDMSYDKFIQAMRFIYEQGAFIHPKALQYVIKEYRELSVQGAKRDRKAMEERRPKRLCTERECEILQLLVDGHNNSSIAKELNISEKTVKNHLTNIFRKLDVKDRTQAAVLAIRNDWVDF